MAWPEPKFSKNKVRQAGKTILDYYRNNGNIVLFHMMDPIHLMVALNWREAHGAVLNTAQAWLRRLEKEQRPIVGQRLKRFSTITPSECV